MVAQNRCHSKWRQRYNLHFRPKSVLVEVGAQTNTLQEMLNAMEPLADVLDKVFNP